MSTTEQKNPLNYAYPTKFSNAKGLMEKHIITKMFKDMTTDVGCFEVYNIWLQ
jgi:hypothetical protein